MVFIKSEFTVVNNIPWHEAIVITLRIMSIISIEINTLIRLCINIYVLDFMLWTQHKIKMAFFFRVLLYLSASYAWNTV